jgi:threonine aldolase
VTARVSDFRSDTVTRPSSAMRRAMAEAEVGDDVLDGDPTVARLERASAEWLGKDGALFVPSGTMANQVAVGSWTRPGEEAICESSAHVLAFEAGALAANFGVQAKTLAGTRGVLDPAEVRRAIRAPFVHSPRTALLCVEQTHMSSGGSVVPLENLRALKGIARDHGVPVHLDGARLANAVVASGIPARDFAAEADSVSLCFSKGLGAPVGSVIAGDAAFLERARVIRKRLGGWMRQSGILAAAALVALEENVERLAEDHALARDLARAVARFDGLCVDPDGVATNLVMVRVGAGRHDAKELATRLAAEGVLVAALSADTLRFVTHLDVGPADVERVAQALERILSAR